MIQGTKALILTQDGEFTTLEGSAVSSFLASSPPPLLVHGKICFETLGITIPPPPCPWLDLLDLFLFAHPAAALPSPTPEGLAQALNLPFRNSPDLLHDIARSLLNEIYQLKDKPHASFLRQQLHFMTYGNWAWGNILTEFLGEISEAEKKTVWQDLQIWKNVPKWEDTPPVPPAKIKPLRPNEARDRLVSLLKKEEVRRPAQEAFAEQVGRIFSLPKRDKTPNLLLAEAETGTGKTLGYLAAADSWAAKNDSCVWISTYTKHLQRQVEEELSRFYPDAKSRNRYAVVLKGRENYLCLLKLQEMALPIFLRAQNNQNLSIPAAIPVGLLLGWVKATKEGDMKGGDLPGWFSHLYGFSYIFHLTDKEDECLHSGCPFYQSCFFEHINRKALHARLVISNHALTLIRLAQAAEKEGPYFLPARHFIFDESHHLQMASDNVFSLQLSLKTMMDFRARLLGTSEATRRRNFKSLHHYLKIAFSEFPKLESLLTELEKSTREILPSPAILHKISLPDDSTEEISHYPAINFLKAIAEQLDLHAPLQKISDDSNRFFEREADFEPSTDAVRLATEEFLRALKTLLEKISRFYSMLSTLPLKEEAENTDLQTNIEIVAKRLEYYILPHLKGWIFMLTPLPLNDSEIESRLHIIRDDGKNQEPAKHWQHVRLCENWLDPTVPLSHILQQNALGVAYVSGTFRPYKSSDLSEDETDKPHSWLPARRRTGSLHIDTPALYDFQPSPFHYQKQAKIYIMTDVDYSIRSLAHAYKELFLASKGGALGIFTAIARLQKVYHAILPALSNAGIDLYAQHMNSADNTQLVDMFRQNKKSCLLGTDAMRDGIDIPGSSLQLVVMEKVPWPRADILHRERKKHVYAQEKTRLEDEEAALRLRQAFGRLIRKSEDKGVFVILERRTPSRLLQALPPEIEIEKIPLKEAIQRINIFFQ